MQNKCLKVLLSALLAATAVVAHAQESQRKPIVAHTGAALADQPANSGFQAINQTILNKFRQEKTTKILIGLNVPYAPYGALSSADTAAQKNDIQSAQLSLIDALPTLAVKNGLKLFSTIPFMAADVDAAEYDAIIKNPAVSWVQEDKLAEPHLAQSNPLIGMQSGAFSGYTGAGKTVAVLDTGVDKNHADLSGRVVSEACYSTTVPTGSYVSSSICPGGASSTATNSALPYSSGVCGAGGCDHGTHVAATAAGASGVARGANIIGIQVFSWFTKCNWAACNTALAYTSDQIAGLERVYALRNTYSIAAVNMSLGGGRYYNQSTCDADNPATKAAIDNLRSVGIATVISSGNDGYSDSTGAPGCISSAVSVGSTWDAAQTGTFFGCQTNPLADAVACYSNSASFLNLLAPGSIITAALPNNGSGAWHGTSMAAPHVAGAWSVVKQKAPTATVSEVLAAFQSSGAAVTDTRNNITKPRINLPAALNAVAPGVVYSLNVAVSGGGSVASSPAGINCGATCGASFASGAVVTLTATPTGNNMFTGWGGACSGTGSCTVNMTAARNVSASFAPGTTLTVLSQSNLAGATNNQQFFSVVVPVGASNLLISTSGGTGDVDLYVRANAVPSTATYDCASGGGSNAESCFFPTPEAPPNFMLPGTTYHIMLHAYGAYSGATLTVSYTVPQSTSFTMTVAKTGRGMGTVTSSPTGIACGATCSAAFSAGSVVSLAATPAVGSRFTGWSGACAGVGACSVSMTGAQNVTAGFSTTSSAMSVINFLLLD